MKRRQFINRTLWFSIGAGVTAACGDRNASPQGRRPEALRFSVTDLQGMEPLKRDFSPFAQALEEVLSLPVELVPLDSFVAAAPALLDEKMDLVMAGPSEYLLLQARAQAVPVVGITRPEYKSRITVRADSDIETVQDLKGKVFGMSAEGATAGHIGASQVLANAGLDPLEDLTIRMVGDDCVQALLAGDIDAFAISPNKTAKFLRKVNGAKDQVRTLVDGAPLPNDVFVASRTLDPDFLSALTDTMVTEQDALLTALLESGENSKYAKSQFVPARDGDYDQIRAMYHTLGLEKLVE